MYFKKLVGEKCYLSPMDENDAEKFTEWLNDLEMTQYLVNLHTRVITMETEKEILKKIANEHNYSIIDISSNELIGSCSFLKMDNLNQSAVVGIFIGNKNYWNKGYGRDALSLLMDYGFKVLNLHTISLRVASFNERAIKCYEKIGFKIFGRKRECLLKGGRRYDMIYMDILYNEFYEKNKNIV